MQQPKASARTAGHPTSFAASRFICVLLAFGVLTLCLGISCRAPAADQTHSRWSVVKRLADRQWKVFNVDAPPETETRPASLRSVYFLDDLHGYAVGDGGTFTRTIDGGQTWTESIVAASLNLYAVFFADAKDGWAAGESSEGWPNRFAHAVLFHTEDGGEHWLVQLTLENFQSFHLSSFSSLSFLNSEHGWVGGFVESIGDQYGPYGIVFGTEDGGKHWRFLSRVKEEMGINAMEFLSPDRGWAAARGGILQTKDGGHHWTRSYRQRGKLYPYLFGLDFNSAASGWVVGSDDFTDSGFALRTTDGGETWLRVQLPNVPHDSPDKALFVYSAAFLSPSRGWLGGNEGLILATNDGGKSWSIEDTGTSQTTISLALTSNALFAVGTRGLILKRSL